MSFNTPYIHSSFCENFLKALTKHGQKLCSDFLPAHSFFLFSGNRSTDGNRRSRARPGSQRIQILWLYEGKARVPLHLRSRPMLTTSGQLKYPAFLCGPAPIISPSKAQSEKRESCLMVLSGCRPPTLPICNFQYRNTKYNIPKAANNEASGAQNTLAPNIPPKTATTTMNFYS